MSALGLGILKSRSLASLPWQVAQLNFANFWASKVWKTTFIFGLTTAFMNFMRWSLFMSFQATSGGPSTLAGAPASAATATSVAIRRRRGETRARRVRIGAIHDPLRAHAQQSSSPLRPGLMAPTDSALDVVLVGRRSADAQRGARPCRRAGEIEATREAPRRLGQALKYCHCPLLSLWQPPVRLTATAGHSFTPEPGGYG